MRLTEKGVRDLIAKYSGNMAAIARAFKVTRGAVRQFIDKRPDLRAELIDARESYLDNAESALQRACIAGEAWAVCFTLKTLGKSRGYIERQELAATVGPATPAEEDLTDEELNAEIERNKKILDRTTGRKDPAPGSV